jgi:IS1 family transposase
MGRFAMNRLSPDRQALCLRLLCEGNSIRGTARVTDTHKNTVERLILQFGQAAQVLLDDTMRNLALEHIEVDEIWTFVFKKQARLTVEERATVHDMGDIYLWTCLDQRTKLVPTFLLGKRSADNARRLMTDLASRLVLPSPHESDDHAFETGQHRTVIQLSTDGFAAYPEAVDLAFGPYVRYGVLIKDFRNEAMAYQPPEMVGADRRPIRNIDNPFTICTSHVERHNLTIRTFMKRFTRLSLGFSKKLECLQAASALFLAYYNFVWRTRFPDRSGQAGRLRRPAAMMAGVTDRLWTFQDLFDELMVRA